MKTYLVTLAMRVPEGPEYCAQRTVEATDPDDASSMGWHLERVRQMGCLVPHQVLRVAMVRRVGGRVKP